MIKLAKILMVVFILLTATAYAASVSSQEKEVTMQVSSNLKEMVLEVSTIG